MSFSRIQFTPDLMPSDVTGSSIWNQRDGDFEFRPGPIFTNLLLADEINRAPPKTQAALLEAMQERQVTIEGATHPLEPPFLVHRDAEPDRVRGHVSAARGAARPLPAADGVRLPEPRGRGRRARAAASSARRTTSSCAPIVDRETLLAMQRGDRAGARRRERSRATASTSWRRRARVAERRGRREPAREARAAQARALPRRARTAATSSLPDDVKAVAVPALAHRLVLRPELWVQRVSAEDVVREVLETRPDAARPRTSRRTRRRDATRHAAARRATRRSRRSGSLGALALAPAGARVVAAPFALAPRRRRALARDRRSSRSASSCGAERRATLEGETSKASRVRAGGGGRPARARSSSFRAASRSSTAGTARSVRFAAGEERSRPLDPPLPRWGVYDARAVRRARARPVRPRRVGERVTASHRCKAYPRPEHAAPLLAPVETQAFAGNQVARTKGDGIEFADIRDFVPGDRVRSINWRASRPAAGLVVNERHPERNTDVVLFVDSFADVRGGERSDLDEAVRAAAARRRSTSSAATGSGSSRFGGVLRWLQPGMGSTQRYRLVETLLETGVEPTYTWRDVNVIPARILPPHRSSSP